MRPPQPRAVQPSTVQPRAVLAAFLVVLSFPRPAAAGLEDELGRSESRVYSAPFPLVAGRTVWDLALAERLERLGYRRVRERPVTPGTFFWGEETFWVYRRPHRVDGRQHPAELFGLALGPPRGTILHGLDEDGEKVTLDEPGVLWLEPELLAEDVREERAVRVPIVLEDLPEHVWRAVLAAEDARFFDHPGLDAKSLARALLANVRAGGVAQGGSTITQQLIKNRDLTPKRTLGRKASEALRALALEAEVSKEEILDAYLDQVYLGHVDGLAVHGLGTAAEVYFGRPAADLDLAQAAALAAMIQGPNRLTPLRHPELLKERRDWVLGRLAELGWVGEDAAAAAKRRPIELRRRPPRSYPARHFRRLVAEVAQDAVGKRLERGRGVVVETELDPWLQALAEEVVADGLDELRRRYRRLRRAPLGVALVALDAESGGVLAYVGGDPEAAGDELDRGRQARRQPGSAVKPLVFLEAFERCGWREPLHPASRLSNEPLRLDLPSGPWEPQNDDGRFGGVVTAREALRRSLNVPAVRIGRWCGFDAVAARFEKAGLELGDEPPPSFVLGAVEVSPLELASAYTVFATPGRRWTARPVRWLERPDGVRLSGFMPRGPRVTSPESAYLVRELLRDAAQNGTARSAAIEGPPVAAKTGTSSDRRDAWLAGTAQGLVTVVWVGRDDGEPLGLHGSEAAAPIWKRFMERAWKARPPHEVGRPRGIVEVTLDPKTGLRVRRGKRGAEIELFRRRAIPPSKRFWRRPAPVVH